MIRNPETLEVKDEGASQGRVRVFDFVGAGVSAAVSGQTATVTIAGGAGSFSITQATVTLPYPASRRFAANVVDAAMGATDKIIVSLAGVAETQTNASDGIDTLTMQALPKAGSFDFEISFLTPAGGPVVINYTRSA